MMVNDGDLLRALQYGIRFISDIEAEQFLTNLSKEVSKRLKAIDRLGRLLTLKIMTRHPDAPLEAPKVCDFVYCFLYLS